MEGAIKKRANSTKKNNDFEILYFKFESSYGCRFKMEVTFPEEDELTRRKNFHTQASQIQGLRSQNHIQKQVDLQVKEYIIDPPSCKAFLTGLNEFKWRRFLDRSKNDVNFIKENLENVGD